MTRPDRHRPEQGNDHRDEAEAEPRPQGDGDADGSPEHPEPLEDGLGPGEHPGPHVVGDVALDQGVEAELRELTEQPRREAQQHERPHRVQDRGGEGGAQGDEGDRRRHPLRRWCPPAVADDRPQRVPRPSGARDEREDDRPGPPRDRVLAHEEGEEEGEEPRQDAGSAGHPEREAHQRRQRTQASRSALEGRQRGLGDRDAVDVDLARGRVDPRGKPDGEHRRRNVDGEGEAQRPVGPDA